MSLGFPAADRSGENRSHQHRRRLDLDRIRHLLEDGGLTVLDLRTAADHSEIASASPDVLIAQSDIAVVQAIKRCRALYREAPVLVIMSAESADEEIVLGQFRLRPMQGALVIGNQFVSLHKIEADILAVLMSHAGKPVHFDVLGEMLHRPHGTTRGSLAVHVCNLRRKLEARPEEPRHLITVRGRGYCFQA